MTGLREAAQQALEALKYFRDTAICSADTDAANEVIPDLEAALAQQAEPVAYRHLHEDGWEYHDAPTGEDCAECQALYTDPPQQAEPVEPVAWMYTGIKQDGTEHGPHLVWKPEYMDAMSASKGAKATPLYTASPRYTLSELVKGMQPGDMPADKEWDAAPPVGREEGSAK